MIHVYCFYPELGIRQCSWLQMLGYVDCSYPYSVGCDYDLHHLVILQVMFLSVNWPCGVITLAWVRLLFAFPDFCLLLESLLVMFHLGGLALIALTLCMRIVNIYQRLASKVHFISYT